MIHCNSRDIANSQWRAIAIGDHHLAQRLGRIDGRDMPDRKPLVRGVDEPTGIDGGRLLNRLQHLGKQNAVHPQPLWIDDHLQLWILFTPNCDVCYARYGHQPRPNGPAGHYGHVHLRLSFRPHADLQAATERRQRRQNMRRSHVRG